MLLQSRQVGTTTWTTRATLATSWAGDAVTPGVTGSLPVRAGIHQWRLHAPAHAGTAAATSAVRTLTARTTITGFATARATKPAGALVKDKVKLTPGSKRTVLVQYRKAGTTTWTTFRTVTANAQGGLTATLKAFPGRSSWRVKAVGSSTHGSAAVTKVRTLRGA